MKQRSARQTIMTFFSRIYRRVRNEKRSREGKEIGALLPPGFIMHCPVRRAEERGR